MYCCKCTAILHSSYQKQCRFIVTSACSYNFFKAVKSQVNKFFKQMEKDHREDFQSWAEFNSRGFIRPEYMECWLINEYGHHSKTLIKDVTNSPMAKVHTTFGELTKLRQSVIKPYDVLIKVHAASINPIDVKMCQGYGKEVLNVARNPIGTVGDTLSFDNSGHSYRNEFPLILGRDFSGTVVDHGMEVTDVKLGDEVYGTPKIYYQGCLSDYVCTGLKGVAVKPTSLSHVEAAALPYCGTIVLQGLKKLLPTLRGKRALILGGSGGTGTIAIQILKAYGTHVSVTCSEKSFKLCTALGASDCFNYSSDTIFEELQSQEKYDVLLDAVGITDPKWATTYLVKGGTYISLNSSFVKDFHRQGALIAGASALTSRIKNLSQHLGIRVEYPLFMQDNNALYEMKNLVENGLLEPVIQDVLSFDDVKQGFDIVETGHTKGKIVINVSGLPEATEKPKKEKIIHL